MLQSVFDSFGSRPSEIVVRNIPPHVMRRLRGRALENKRSVQDELYAILEEAVLPNVAASRDN